MQSGEVVDPADRAQRVARYERQMADIMGESLWGARAVVVARYLGNAGVFPSGPDGRAWGGAAWFEPREWRLNEKGEAERTVTTVTVERSVTESKRGGRRDGAGRKAEGGLRTSDAERARRYRARLKLARGDGEAS